ncbi:MAG: PEP-CTERM sorting domain-containing protein [Burkholderiales bacterium]|nr:PEP-CTERM sorting domain-containing protein [Burkholderiales bacterium]
MLGTTVSHCDNTVYSGSVTADPSACDGSTSQASPGSAVVGAGVEFSIGGNRLLDFGDDTLTITYIQPVGSASPDLFIFDLDPSITSVSLLGTNALNVSWVFSGDHLGILVGSPLLDGTVVLSINVGTAVPEPASLALVGAALLGIGAARRRRA